MSKTHPVIKRPFKYVEIPIRKFKDEAIPHHEKIFREHKNTVQKLMQVNDVPSLQRESKNKKRIVQQLKNLMYELDTLRAQVEDADLDKFDSSTVALRKSIIQLLNEYTKLEAEIATIVFYHSETDKTESQDPMHNASEIQLQVPLEQLKLSEQQRKLQQLESLNQDIETVHEIFVNLNDMVVLQQDAVNHVEDNVEVTNDNVTSGLKQLIMASRYKKATYPVTGALLGTIIGGPIGSVAGLKIGGIAAIGCGLFGYFGGKFVKEHTEDHDLPSQTSTNSADLRSVAET